MESVEQERQLTRRRVVGMGATAAAGVVGLTSLAACGSGGDAAASGSTAPTTSADAAGDSGGGGELAKLADVPVGGAVSATGSDGKPIIIAQPASGDVVAFSAICTHQGCTVAPKGAELDCPCHGSKFKLDGTVINGPATKALNAVPVTVSGDSIFAG